MRLLLDTHVAIWAVSSVETLPESVAAMIAEPANEVSVSMASLWEIAIKNSLGPRRTAIGLSTAQAIEEFTAASFEVLPIEVRHALGVERLPHLHGDPFDRLLIATAEADTYRLVTHDRALAAYGDYVILV
ncbi:type II toxin-antitoxin system VapC family toxin [Sphingomonas koreensis]|nr:type II toxin-antitoxin system VapC family toxin [Sphingomonas koreensis]